jgi:sigma-B regulation protein RsbU (phosphoserine phosphatase)
MDDLRSLLHKQPILGEMSPASIDALIQGGRQQSFHHGDILLQEGAVSDSAVLILEGELEVSVQTAYGPVTLTVMSGPALMGEIGVLANLPRTATVRALSAGQALWIDDQLFARLSEDHPAILRRIVAVLGQRIASFNQAIGFYTNALAALERDDLDPNLLDDLRNPPAELLSFAVTFRKMADQIVSRLARMREMASAAAIQRAMLPDPLPADGNGTRFTLFADMRAAKEVGGDFYDAFLITPDRLAITVGDVSGKGVPASLFMAVCQTVMRMLLRQESNLARAVSRADEMLDASNREFMFATFFVAVLDLPSGELTYCNCGHNPPLLMRGDICERLAAEDPPLAVASPHEYTMRTTRLSAGDSLLLYTDGVTEAHRSDNSLFGDERLSAVAHEPGRLDGLIGRIMQSVDTFADGRPQFDDMACVALGYHGG